jgi:hypothetical protein
MLSGWSVTRPENPPAPVVNDDGDAINQAAIDTARDAITTWMANKPPDPPPPLLTGSAITNQDAIDAATGALNSWTSLNRKLYGVIIMAIPPWLATSLHLSHRNDGVGALGEIAKQFDVVNQNDRASAIAKVYGRYIDGKADLSEADLRHQRDSMMVANAEIRRTGGTAFPDELLISVFDNSLPAAYTQIRQLVRRSAHTTFEAHYQDYRAIPNPMGRGQQSRE